MDFMLCKVSPSLSCWWIFRVMTERGAKSSLKLYFQKSGECKLEEGFVGTVESSSEDSNVLPSSHYFC